MTDNQLANTVLTAYQQKVGQFIQPNHLNTGLTDEQLNTACDLLTTLELIVPGDSGFGDFKEYKITKLGLFVATSSGGLLKWLSEEKNKVNPSSLYKIMNKPQDTTITADNLHIGDNIHSSSFRDFKPINNPTNPEPIQATKEINSSLLTVIWHTISHNPLVSTIVGGLILWLITQLL